MKINCWEFMKCGREPGGENAEELGICPAAVYDKLDCIHGGKNAGRVCWIVAGTMCAGEVVGSFAKKYNDCRECKFYQMVKEEEDTNFLITVELINWFAKKK
jgi:hypothetical protein